MHRKTDTRIPRNSPNFQVKKIRKIQFLSGLLSKSDSKRSVWDVVDVVEWVIRSPVKRDAVAPNSLRTAQRVFSHGYDNMPLVITAKFMLWSSINTRKNHDEFLKSYPLDNVLGYLFFYFKGDRRSCVRIYRNWESS